MTNLGCGVVINSGTLVSSGFYSDLTVSITVGVSITTGYVIVYSTLGTSSTILWSSLGSGPEELAGEAYSTGLVSCLGYI